MKVEDLDKMLSLSAMYYTLGTLSDNVSDFIDDDDCPEALQKDLEELEAKIDSTIRKVEDSMDGFREKYNVSVNGEI